MSMKTILSILQVAILSLSSFAGTLDRPGTADYVTADKLLSEFSKNAVKAKQTYEAKTFTVMGRVTSIDTSSRNTVIIFEGSNGEVRCELANASAAQDLHKGGWVKLSGYCDGETYSHNIVFKGCEIVKQ